MESLKNCVAFPDKQNRSEPNQIQEAILTPKKNTLPLSMRSLVTCQEGCLLHQDSLYEGRDKVLKQRVEFLQTVASLIGTDSTMEKEKQFVPILQYLQRIRAK
jgi:hypothetical protein